MKDKTKREQKTQAKTRKSFDKPQLKKKGSLPKVTTSFAGSFGV